MFPLDYTSLSSNFCFKSLSAFLEFIISDKETFVNKKNKNNRIKLTYKKKTINKHVNILTI